MHTRQISFAIQGMFCAKCAVAIERALTRLDGVLAAHVNFATERATVVFDPLRVSGSAMANAVRGEGFDVPLQQVVLNVGDLLYVSSARTVGRVLSHLDGVVRVATDLQARRVVLDVFYESVRESDYAHALGGLGLRAVERLAPNAPREFLARAVIVTILAMLSLWSAGAHAGLFDAGPLHAPLVVIAISVVVSYGVGWPFYRLAYDTFTHGEYDASVVVALIASLGLLGGMPLALASSATWFTASGFVLATLLTAGWFLTRSVSVWVLPSLRRTAVDNTRAAQAPLGVISHGSRG